MTARVPDREQPAGGARPFDACACGHMSIDHIGGGPCEVSRGGKRVDNCTAFEPAQSARPRPAEPTVDGLAELEALREMVRKLPRPTEAEQDAAALDYAQTALSEAWAALVEIRDWDSAAAERHGGIGVREYAAQYLEANGFQS